MRTRFEGTVDRFSFYMPYKVEPEAWSHVTVDASLTARFEAARPQLGAIAYRKGGQIMLATVPETSWVTRISSV